MPNTPRPTKNLQLPYIITITFHLDELKKFFGEKRWRETPQYATFDAPLDVRQFCDTQWNASGPFEGLDNKFFPSLYRNSTLSWYIDVLSVMAVDMFAVLKFLDRSPVENKTSTHQQDWNDLLDFATVDTDNRMLTDGIVSKDGYVHFQPVGNTFRITSNESPTCRYHLTYTIFFSIPVDIDGNGKTIEYMYCKIDPVIRNNTDQEIPC